MNSAVGRFGLLRTSVFGLSVLLALFVSGCGDKSAPTQPQGTPIPVGTPTPGPFAFLGFVSVSPGPAVPPPAGFKQAATISFVVRESFGVGANLTTLKVGDPTDFGNLGDQFQVVSVGPSVRVSPRADTTFTAVVATNVDSCSIDGVGFQLTFTDDHGHVEVLNNDLGCTWPGLFE